MSEYRREGCVVWFEINNFCKPVTESQGHRSSDYAISQSCCSRTMHKSVRTRVKSFSWLSPTITLYIRGERKSISEWRATLASWVSLLTAKDRNVKLQWVNWTAEHLKKSFQFQKTENGETVSSVAPDLYSCLAVVERENPKDLVCKCFSIFLYQSHPVLLLQMWFDQITGSRMCV